LVDWINFLLLFLVGCLAGTLNVLAAGGSFLTLPVLILMGLPPTVANGTNRVAIFLQNAGAVWSYHRHGVLDWSYALWAALPAVFGSAFGTWIALSVSDEIFKNALAFLMVVITLWTLFEPLQGRFCSPAVHHRGIFSALGFFGVGIYGGFVQAGVGFTILAITTITGLDLVKGNAVKGLIVLATVVISLPIFAWQGKVEWLIGFTLAFGTVLGGLLGVRLAILKGHRWVKGVVTVAIIVFALKLWLGG
jgi:uncharacterized protein